MNHLEHSEKTSRPEEGLFWVSVFILFFVGVVVMTAMSSPQNNHMQLSNGFGPTIEQTDDDVRVVPIQPVKQYRYPTPYVPEVRAPVPNPYQNVRIRPAYRSGPQTIPSMVDERDTRRWEEEREWRETSRRQVEENRQRYKQDEYHRNRYDNLKEQYFSNGATWEDRSRLQREMDNEMQMMSPYRY